MVFGRNLWQLYSVNLAVLLAGLLSGCYDDRLSTGNKQSIQDGHPLTPERGANIEVPPEIQSILSANGAYVPKHDESYGRTNARVQLTNVTVKQVDSLTHKISVDYRFSQGKPDPSREYSIYVKYSKPFCENKILSGNQLETAGHLEWNFAPPPIPSWPAFPPPRMTVAKDTVVPKIEVVKEEIRFDMVMYEQIGKGSFIGISDLCKGTVISD
jgi:hypothetical protein